MRNTLIAITLALSACSSNGGGTSSSGTSGTTSTTTSSAGTTTASGTTTSQGTGTATSTGTATGTASGTTGTGTATGTTSTGTTGSCSDCVTVTYTDVDIHPAAKAALQSIGFPVPSVTQGQYVLILNQVEIVSAAPKLVPIGREPITSLAGPYSFTVDPNAAVLGVLAGISLDAGVSPVPPTCPQWNTFVAGVGTVLDAGGTSTDVASYLADAGFQDFIMPTGSQVGGVATPPTANVSGAFAYAIPMSYAEMLNCAGNPTKTTWDGDAGVAVIYATSGQSGSGNALPAVQFSINGAGNTIPPTVDYYSSDYAQIDTSGSGQTDATGVATVLNVLPGKVGFATVGANDPASDSFFPEGAGIATQANGYFSVTLGTQQ